MLAQDNACHFACLVRAWGGVAWLRIRQDTTGYHRIRVSAAGLRTQARASQVVILLRGVGDEGWGGGKKKNEKVGSGGVTRWPPGNTLSPGNIFPQRNKVTRWPPVTPPLRTAASLFSLLSPVSGWCQGPVCFGFGVSFSSLFLYRYTVEKGPRERLGDALWRYLWRYLWRCPMAIPYGQMDTRTR